MKHSKDSVYYSLELFLNEKGIKQLIKIQKELDRKVQEIMSDEKNKGDIPCFSMSCIYTLLNTKMKETK